MTSDIFIEKTDDTAFLATVEAGLNAHNFSVTGEKRIPVNFILKDKAGRAFGGMKASCTKGRFLVSWLFVPEELRGCGYGRELMGAAEREARALQCQKIFVDTMSFQAPEFYQKIGYQICARIEGFYDGYDRIFFQKVL